MPATLAASKAGPGRDRGHSQAAAPTVTRSAQAACGVAQGGVAWQGAACRETRSTLSSRGTGRGPYRRLWSRRRPGPHRAGLARVGARPLRMGSAGGRLTRIRRQPSSPPSPPWAAAARQAARHHMAMGFRVFRVFRVTNTQRHPAGLEPGCGRCCWASWTRIATLRTRKSPGRVGFVDLDSVAVCDERLKTKTATLSSI
jgi:hypothetical protein